MKISHPFFEDKFQPFVHRGCRENYSENTLEAFKESVDLGYKYIETDLRLTKDKRVIVFHDNDFNRLAKINKKVQSLTLREIKNIKLIKGGTILELTNLLEEFPKIKFNIDIKDSRSLIPTIEVLDSLNAYSRVCLASFKSSILWRLKKIRPQSCVSMGIIDTAIFKIFHKIINDVDCIQVPIKWRGINVLTKKLIDMAHLNNLKIHVWTINSEEEIFRLINLKVDGIMTDNAVLLKKIIDEYKLFDFAPTSLK